MVEADFDRGIRPSYKARNKKLHVVLKKNHLAGKFIKLEEEVWQKELTDPMHTRGRALFFRAPWT